ncbi:hypothetical protein LPB90_16380 [Chryseobacterium sp. LC2016-29]|uniref:hypothetical protein n=1 Tax=Chryseobacterium sp. LC2016-29 TaxID=2897331 RepID=UPI001E563578|nr:hypothetical protein [Chryseobacterium sp. LC2016-29]MCD0480031.1 hypothetical protein [Chryseobacterium sp. LC2016-29]
MRTKILLLFLLGWVGMVSAQIKTKVFELNLGKPSKNALTATDSSNKLVIKTNQLLSFDLKNANPYKYKYVINHRFVDLYEGQGYNPLDSIGKVVPMKNVTTQNSETKINASIKDLESELKTLKSLKINSTIKQKGIDSLEKKITELHLELLLFQQKKQHNSLSEFSTNFIKGKETANEEEDKANIKNATKVLQKSFNDLKVNVDTYIAEISAEDFLEKDAFDFKRKTFNTSYISLLSASQNIGNEAENFPETSEYFSKKLKSIDSISVKIKNEISKMYQLKLYNYLLPIDINGKNIDVVEVTLERYDKSITNPIPDKYTYNIWINGGLKIDISGGVFLTSLMDKEYETKDDTGNNKFIYTKEKGDYDFGFGSMINLSLRGGSWVRPALSIGALFTTNQKFQILTGFGLILGKEERLVLHGGLTMGAVSRISDQYKTNGETSYDLGTEGTVATNNKFSFGHFFGITYNFGKVKKQEPAK